MASKKKTNTNWLDNIKNTAGAASNLATSVPASTAKVSEKKNVAGKSTVGGTKTGSGLKKSTSSSSMSTAPEVSTWMQQALDLYKNRNTDAQFGMDYFDGAKNPEMEEIFGIDLKTATPMMAAKKLDTIIKLQAGINYRSANGFEYDYNGSDALYGANNTINQQVYLQQEENWLKKVKDTANEADLNEILAYWKTGIDSATDNSEYKRRLQERYDELSEWAGNTYTSFAGKEVNAKMTALHDKKRQLNSMSAYNRNVSAEDTAAAQTAMEWLYNGVDPVAMVQNDEKLRRITNFDALVKQYSDPFELGDALRASISDAAQKTSFSQAAQDEINVLEDEIAILQEQMIAAIEKRDAMAQRDSYKAIPEQVWAKTAAAGFNVPKYYAYTNYETFDERGNKIGDVGYNAPTLAQIIADPEAVNEEYRKYMAATGETGLSETIGLVRQMDADDVFKYKALYREKGEEAAAEFFEYMMPELRRRETAKYAESTAEFADKHPITATLAALGTNALGQLSDTANAISTLLGGEPVDNQFGTITSTARTTVGQNIEENADWANVNWFGDQRNILGWLYNGVNSIADEGIRKVLFGPLSALYSGVSAGAAEFNDSYAQRGNVGASLLSGILTGISEGGSEKIGDLVKFGNGPLRFLGDTVVEGAEEIVSALGQTGGQYVAGELYGVGSEIADRLEYLRENGYNQGEALSILVKEYGPDIVEQGIIGMIAGAGMSGSNAVVNTAQTRSENLVMGRQIEQQGNLYEILKAGMESNINSVKNASQNLINKLNLDDSSKPVLPDDAETADELKQVQEGVAAGQQAEAAPEAPETAEKPAEEQQPDETEVEIRKLNRREARKVGDIYRKVMRAMDVEFNKNRETLSNIIKEKLSTYGDKRIQEVTDAIADVVILGEDAPTESVEIAEAEAMRDGAIKEVVDAMKVNMAQLIEFTSATTRNIKQAAAESKKREAERQAEAAEQAPAKTATTINKGSISYTTEEGETVSAELEGFTTNEAGEVAAIVGGSTVPVSNLDIADEGSDTLIRSAAELGNAEAATLMYDSYEEGQNVKGFADAFEAAYHYGEAGIEKAKAATRSLVKSLTAQQFDKAYVAGAAAAAARPRQSASTSGGKVSFAGRLSERLDGLLEGQKSAIDAMSRLVKGLGTLNVEFFESEADETGSYMESDNGWYDPNTNTIHIDVHAGRNNVNDSGNYALLRVASHELTHYIKAQNTEGFKSLQQFVTDQISENGLLGDVTFDALVEQKMDQAAARNRTLSYDAAVEEVVADGCEMMLQDSTAIQQLAEKNESLFNRIRTWISDFAKHVQNAFRGVRARSYEAKLIKDVRELQKRWDDALVGAMENVWSKQGSANTEAAPQPSYEAAEQDVKFSARTAVEYAKDLIAVHNLDSSKLSKALELGGFPMPSIAITKNNIGHQNFGDISLVFGRETIDPKTNKKNKVYSADAWTPTFPKIDYEADPKAEKRVRTKLTDLGNRMESYLGDKLRQVVYGIDEYLNRFEGEEGFIDYAMQNYGLKAAFLEDQGQHVDMAKTQKRVGKEYSAAMAASYQKVIDLFDGDMEKASKMPLGQIRSEYGDALEQVRPGSTNSALQLGALIRHASEYQQSANQPPRYEMVVDYGATERSIDERIDEQAFSEWAKELFRGIEGNSGVYNNKPLFTDSGNRRSFASTHMPVTVENIAKAMATQGNTKNISGFHGIKSVRAATAKTFKNVSEMHAAKGRIQNRTEAETEALNEEMNNRLYAIMGEVLKEKYPNGNTGIEYTYSADALGEIFLEIAETNYSASSIQKALSGYGYNVDTATAESIKSLFDDTAAMPVNMYEAKPERAVGFDEVEFAVVPDDLEPSVKDRLAKVVPDIREYPSGDENARLDVLNSRSDVMFSQRDGIEFLEDKYYGRRIDNFDDEKHGSYLKVGKVLENSILHKVGLPVADLYFDNSKISRTLTDHAGDIDKNILKQIPDMLRNPVVITEDGRENNINVFGDVWVSNSPVLVGIVVTNDASGWNVISKIRTVHPKRNAAEKISDTSVLYLDGDKKRTRDWFHTLGTHLPLGGTKFGFIRSIARPEDPVKSSMRTDSPSDRDLLAEAFEGVAQNENERGYLEKYKGQIEDLNAKQSELSNIRREIRDMMFTPGKRDSEYNRKLAALKGKANALAEAINRADRRLLMLESAKPLKDVLARERAKADKKAAEMRRESLAAARERRETTELRKKIRGLADDFNRRLKNPTQKSYIPQNMVQLIIAAQELVDTRSGREGVKAQEKLAQIHTMYERYKSDGQFAYVYDPVIGDMLEKLANSAGGKNIYQLNKAELTDIYNTMKALRKQVTEAVKLKAGTYAANIIEAGKEMYRETQEAAPLFKGKFSDFLNWQLTPDKFFARLAGYKKKSIWSGVAKSFSDGTQKMLEIQRDAYYHFRKWTESKEFDRLNNLKNLVDIGLKDSKGNAVKITRGMMLEVYMHLSSDDNMRAFMYGGFSVPDLKKYYAGKIAESYGTGSVNTMGTSAELAELAEKLRDPELTEEQQAEIQQQMEEAEMRGMDRIADIRAAIESKLTAWDRGLIAAVHRWNDGNSRDYINDVTLDMYGIKRAQVDNYYPIRRDKAFVNTDFESISRNMNLENWGSLKDRVPSRAPILLGDIAFTVDTSVNQMSRYVGYARAQRDFNKLYNVRMPGMAGSVKKIVGTKFGAGDRAVGASGEKYLENYIGSITGSRHAESDFLSVIRRNLPRATMTLNARVAFSQLSAIPKAAAEVGWDSMISGLANGGAKAIFSKKAREELAQQNAWFWQRYRGEGGQREFADIKGGSGLIDKGWNKLDDLTKGWLLNWCQDFDVMSTVSMWSMAKAWARKHSGFREGTAEFTEAANQKYTDILRNTQAANTVSERSDLARETRPLSILTMYKSEAFANFNMLYDAVATLRKYGQDAKTGKNEITQADVKKAKLQLINSSVSVVVGASLTNAVLKLAVNALTSAMNNYRDEEDEITLKSTLTAILNEVLNDTASMVTFGGETYDLFIGSKVFGDAYYAPNDMALSEILDAVEYANNVFNKEDATIEDYQKAGGKIFTKVCNMLGIPYNNVKRQAKGLADTIADIAAGEAFSFEASADRNNGTNYRRMLKASLAGDDAKYMSVLAELEENGVNAEGAQAGYRDKLKEAYEDGEVDRDRAIELLVGYGGKSEDDAYWQVEKWEYSGDGDYSKYTDLRTALTANNSADAKAAADELLAHGVKEETLASQISTMYGKGEATSILALQIRPGRLYTPSVKEGQEEKKDDFNALLAAVLAGSGVKEEISKLHKAGYSTKKIMSALNGAFGKSADRYAIMMKYNPTEGKILEERVLDAYVALGLDREKERAWIHETWTMPEEE